MARGGKEYFVLVSKFQLQRVLPIGATRRTHLLCHFGRCFRDFRPPMTSTINTLRGLLLGVPMTNEIWIALAWCIGIIIVAVGVYKSKLTK